jgi:hypothetical protein
MFRVRIYDPFKESKMIDRISALLFFMRLAAALLLGSVIALLLAGCASNPKVLPTTGPHPPTTPDQVQLYQAAPSEYEVIDVVYAPITPGVHWDDQGNADAGFDKLKADAAAVGANGLLLTAPPGTSDLTVIAGYHGMMFKVPIRSQPKAAVCQAIWVVKQ